MCTYLIIHYSNQNIIFSPLIKKIIYELFPGHIVLINNRPYPNNVCLIRSNDDEHTIYDKITQKFFIYNKNNINNFEKDWTDKLLLVIKTSPNFKISPNYNFINF